MMLGLLLARKLVVDFGALPGPMIKALRELFTCRHASFHGDYISFDNVETFPKPVQDPLPI
jgi:hypothetical protein